MSPGILVATLLSVAVLGVGCAGSDARLGDRGYRYGSASSNEGYYGIIDSIDAASAGSGGNAVAGAVEGGAIGGVPGRPQGSGARDNVAMADGAAGRARSGDDIGKVNTGRDLYAIRVRFDDSSYRTVTQVGLDGLRVGDGVRIERDRVRHY